MLFFFPRFKSIVLLPLGLHNSQEVRDDDSSSIPIRLVSFAMFKIFLSLFFNNSIVMNLDFFPCILFLSWPIDLLFLLKFEILGLFFCRYIFCSIQQRFFLDSDDMYSLDHLMFSLRFFLVIFLSVSYSMCLSFEWLLLLLFQLC